ncbi:pyridoxamine 5'-phosphate oxidase family protein [Nocardioides sp.]|uniref:pyridoxamine 5'-phosphate oxidase family protein n=1 Tax=Nocardioides sp. TaxID=35761 RepID=UPI0039E62AB6
MTAEELDRFLAQERTCRVATVSRHGQPHVSPLWFVWDGTSLWLNSVVRSQRWTDIRREPRIGVVVDAGAGFQELRGVELSGVAEQVGEAPRQGLPNDDLAVPESLFAHKYTSSGRFEPDGHHGWLRLTPAKVVSWDFRKRAQPARRG